MEKGVAERVSERLAKYIGAHNARAAVKTFAPKAAGVEAERLTAHQVPELMAALRPMLRTLVGEEAAEKLVADICREFAP